MRWLDGHTVHPEGLNLIMQYSRDCVADAAEKRLTKGMLCFQFVTDVGTAYTQADPLETRTVRFTCPVTCIVERALLNANLTSSAEVTWSITTAAGGVTPTGATAPLLSTAAAVASAATDFTDFNVDRFVLTAGTEYKIIVSSSGTFTLERCDLTLHIATDRWTPAGVAAIPEFTPVLVTDLDVRDAAALNTNTAALTTQANLFAANKNAPAPIGFVRHAFLSGTSVNLLRWSLPRVDGGRAQGVVRRIYLYVSMATTGGTTVTATLQNTAGAALTTVTANVAGFTQVSADSGVIAQSLVGPTGAPANTADDYRIVLANAAAAVSCLKAQVIVWISR